VGPVAAAEPQATAPSSISANQAEAQQLRAEVQQLRLQLRERDAKERQLLAEVATLSRYAGSVADASLSDWWDNCSW
jgi:cell division protein FtsL